MPADVDEPHLPEWSAAWAKPQPGMLLDALHAHGVGPGEALMLGYDFVDEQAASLAGVAYLDQQHLIGVEHFDAGFDEGEVSKHLVEPGAAGAVRAPGSFAAEKRSKEARHKPVPLPRSPQASR